MLVNKCKIYNEDSHARSAHYKSISEKKSGNQNCGKPYRAPADKEKYKDSCGKKTSGGGTSDSVKYFSYGGMGHRANECKSYGKKCFKYGKAGHNITDCKRNVMTCFNCVEPGHTSTQFQKPKKAQFGGKVFASSGAETTRSYNLIRGTCFINGVSQISMIDTGTTHSLISLDCARKLNLEMSFIVGSMVNDTPNNYSVGT